jgi:hypothetical protein
LAPVSLALTAADEIRIVPLVRKEQIPLRAQPGSLYSLGGCLTGLG